jgi:hypothetical protein
VYRGTTLGPEVIEGYREAARTGDPVVESGFTSTTSDPSAAFGGNTRFVIRSEHGKDVSPISVFGTEQEVLFRAGTRFRVLSVTESAAGEHVIMLEGGPLTMRDRADDDQEILRQLTEAAEEQARILADPARAHPVPHPDKYADPIGFEEEGRPLPRRRRSDAAGDQAEP